MLDFIRAWRNKQQDERSPSRLGAEFDLNARTESAQLRLEWAAKLAYDINRLGEEYQQRGYSTGGITAQVATVSGRSDGAPKMDPVTVAVADKAGAPLLALRVLKDDAGARVEVDGLSPAAQDALARMPATFDDPFNRVRGALTAMTPDWEIGASVATVKQGGVVFGSSMDADSRAQIDADWRQKRLDQKAAVEEQAQAAAQSAVVLQTPTTVGGPLKLKAKV